MLMTGWESAAAIAVGVAVTTAIWWLTEAMPLGISAVLPIALYLLFGVLEPKVVGSAVGSTAVLLLLGSFLLSIAMERTGAHRRAALVIAGVFGRGSGRGTVFAFIITAGFLSMWMTNTATTAMLFPVAMVVIAGTQNPARLRAPLLLAIAYAASIGGMSTPIGTVPNAIFVQHYQAATGVEFGFLEWMSQSLPIVLIGLPLMGLWVTRNLGDLRVPSVRPEPGWSRAEVRVVIILVLTLLAWLTRKQPFGGWSEWLELSAANDAAVALLAALALYMTGDARGGRLLQMEDLNRVRWDVLLLVAGGICIALALTSTGVSAAIGRSLTGLGTLPMFALILCLCLGVTFLTELTSNAATTSLLMPVLAATAIAIDIDPILLMFPATISASCAFMLPAATPPNAVVLGGGISVARMAREGLVLNIGGALLIALIIWSRSG